ncbi:acyltransferase [Jannaschia pagri]|uniref:Acyltransferase n=1 Tax=Jannaschia pagri TaxID=2829797 RepID=A0ABQ4NNK9_9RHOB|nr:MULTISPECIES: acyltransferase [unclassified Jannaschia]GIT92016.1 acyltransferase [Jannaschia sp. AI_61]GIT95850.1 acyltransferase [Jannaschia sp. AI_62]
MSGGPADRFAAVDGLRTFAILWVALYHYAVFWTPAGRGLDLVPYGDALAWIPLASVGDLGVSLFFIVSGFVISLSLERSRSILAFAALRLLRLWPTLLACGALTFCATSLLGPPELQRSFVEAGISLLFLPPEHVGRALGIGQLEWLDGAYWSLWVEVRFYGIAAILYFAWRRMFLLGWTVFALGSWALHTVILGPDHPLSGLLFTEHQPYFTMGIALAAWRQGGPRPGHTLLWALGAIQALTYADPELTNGIGTVIVIFLATAVILWRRPVPVLSAKPMVRAGQASYAYYLLHQNLGLALLTAFGPLSVPMGIALMLVIQAALIAVSIWFTERVEAPLRARLRQYVGRSAPA